MSYRSESIAAVMSRLNLQYFLPAIQREFVWKPAQILSLFDSIMREYPIGSFLFWELKPENRQKWEAYRFVENARQGGTHNQLANTDGVPQLALVLDGQQRLSSFLVGLRGTYEIKTKHKRRGDPDAWRRNRLYLDLLKDPQEAVEDDDIDDASVRYGFSFFEKPPDPTTEHRWFPVGRILSFDTQQKFDEFLDSEEAGLPESVTKRQINVLRRNLERLHTAVWKDETIAYYTEHLQDYDRALDIFVRANEGGTKLTKSDLLLSMVTSKWGGVSARDEIHGFVHEINNGLTRRNNLNKDFVMKSCLVLTDLSVAYKVENFNNHNLSLIQDRWEDIKSAIRRGVDLVNFFGIDGDNLTSANALIPIIYYLFHRPKLTLRGTTPFEVRNAGAVRRWLGAALLNGAFGGHSDTMLGNVREVLQEDNDGDNFPVNEINRVIRRANRTADFDTDAIGNVVELRYGNRRTFLALSLLYEDNSWGTMGCHQDHIFPTKMFSPRNLSEFGMGAGQIERWQGMMGRLVNLELLLAHENEEKSDTPFEEWITTRDSSFKKKHLIPDDPDLWRLERFEDFFKAREELIAERLRRLFAGYEPERAVEEPPDRETVCPEPELVLSGRTEHLSQN